MISFAPTLKKAWEGILYHFEWVQSSSPVQWIVTPVENWPFYTSGLTATTSERRLPTTSNMGFVKQKTWYANEPNGDSLKSAKIWHYGQRYPFSQIRSQIALFYTTGLSINDVVTCGITVDQDVGPPCLLSSRKGVYRVTECVHNWRCSLKSNLVT